MKVQSPWPPYSGCFVDSRAQAQVVHGVEATITQRVFGTALGYEQLIDHDHLPDDSVLATLAGKLSAQRNAVEATMTQRVFGTALGYEHLIDHDHLRDDSVLATLAGKLSAQRKTCVPTNAPGQIPD